MDNVLVATFLTGLTAGGLSCFAVQGGLLSGSFARQVEGKPSVRPANKKQPAQAAASPVSNKNMALSVLLFLAAKLAAYTLLGFGLGWLGSFFFLSPLLKGFIQIGIGIFLVGNALRMFNVHPIFRYFSFEPPSSLTRYIRRISKGNDRLATPLFLGALTVLIPCGVTQSAMAVAMGTGSPLMGAAIMFAFVLGTSPTFFGVTVLAAGLAKAFQKYFYPIVAIIVLGLGLYTVDGGLNLVGSPFSSSAIIRFLTEVPQVDGQGLPAASTAPVAAGSNVVKINVLNSGYQPGQTVAPAGKPIQLVLTTKNVQSCSRAFVIPSLNLQKLLPATGETVINIPAQKAGTSMRFTCSMGMYNGVIQFQ
jgi:sulfite exporter TauE/SafE